jgi:fatty acid desaturase
VHPQWAEWLAVFGLYMGSSFAPNHIGMAPVSPKLKLDFLRRQVLMSRNISGGAPISVFMGGLNYQIEHHLFPSMARPYLRKHNRSSRPTAPPKASPTPAPRFGSPTASSSATSTVSDYAARTPSSAPLSLNAAPSSRSPAPLRSKANGVAKRS